MVMLIFDILKSFMLKFLVHSQMQIMYPRGLGSFTFLFYLLYSMSPLTSLLSTFSNCYISYEFSCWLALTCTKIDKAGIIQDQRNWLFLYWDFYYGTWSAKQPLVWRQLWDNQFSCILLIKLFYGWYTYKI